MKNFKNVDITMHLLMHQKVNKVQVNKIAERGIQNHSYQKLIITNELVNKLSEANTLHLLNSVDIVFQYNIDRLIKGLDMTENVKNFIINQKESRGGQSLYYKFMLFHVNTPIDNREVEMKMSCIKKMWNVLESYHKSLIVSNVKNLLHDYKNPQFNPMVEDKYRYISVRELFEKWGIEL